LQKSHASCLCKRPAKKSCIQHCLNLAEGSGKASSKEKTRFYTISMGSLREVQSIIKLEDLKHLEIKADHLGACLYKLMNT